VTVPGQPPPGATSLKDRRPGPDAGRRRVQRFLIINTQSESNEKGTRMFLGAKMMAPGLDLLDFLDFGGS
jgi:hypothetical protein